ncbi:polymorphic toxin-type HINT domain-containing protein [Streptomyces sp. NPDC058391]|uniref:polymorphic toxin-type HINT domain-containing protein n=1 Tax=Streptomyces sp. NPDC058391 TaxID=3346476 RepID=UPI003658976A
MTATAEHPFWVPKENAWVNAADLKSGATLSTPHGTKAKITANRPYKDHVRTYNFSVAKLHTYYALAGTTPILVHNTCSKPGPAQEGSTLEDYANANHGKNQASIPDFVTEYTAPSGNRYWGRTQGNAQIEPGSHLDDVLGVNGRDTCSDICALNKAQIAEGGAVIFGGSFRTLRVRPLGSEMESGVPMDPCTNSCQTVIRKTFGTR